MNNMLLIIILLFVSMNVFAENEFPSEYMGVTLLETNFAEVTQKYGPSTVFDIPDGHHDKGVCYRNENVHVVFSTGPMGGNVLLSGISISVVKPKYPCTAIKIEVPNCFGRLCLKKTREEFESIAGEVFIKTTKGDSYVSAQEYQRPMSKAELERSSYASEHPYFDVTHTLWYKESSSIINAFGFYKYETN